MFINQKEIILDKSEVLLKLLLNNPDDLNHFEIASGEWEIAGGKLQGTYRENAGGMLYSKMSAPGDIMLDFYGEMVPPCANDLNFNFKTEGYDYGKQDAGRGYIGGLNGWWEKKAGIERYPSCSPAAATTLFTAESGVPYHIQTGVIEGFCFLFVDGRLVVEMIDTGHDDFAAFGRFGFGTYCSQVKYSNLTVYRPAWKHRELRYTAEF